MDKIEFQLAFGIFTIYELSKGLEVHPQELFNLKSMKNPDERRDSLVSLKQIYH